MTADQVTHARLLSSAQAILDGTIAMPHHQAPRAAAFLARQGLEDLALVLCVRHGIHSGMETMGARLIVLRERVDRTTADKLERAWAGLSRACHHHAFELPPTASEVRGLIELVTSIPPSDPN